MRVIFLAASALALGVAACAPHVNYAARTALDCPDRQGNLVRTSVSADRKTCVYRGGEGVDVTLQLTPVNGDAHQTLGAIEASLVGPTPAAAPANAEAPAAPAPPKPPAPPSADAVKAAREASEDAGGSGASGEDWSSGHDRSAAVDGAGHGVVVGDGDHANINLPGLHIEAGDNTAKVNVGGLQIDAAEDEATIHMFREVRLQGEAFSRERNGLRATFIAKRDNLPDGYRVVGYQASGPKSGPLTVALVRSRESFDHHDRLYRDIERLVRRNGGA